MDYTLVPIHIGKIQVDLGIMTFRMNYGVKEWIPMISWYVKAAGKHVLIDTGISAKRSAVLTEAQIVDTTDLEDGLNRVGITADDVDLVIQTHLHYDHAGTRIACGKREWSCRDPNWNTPWLPIPCRVTYTIPLFCGIFVSNWWKATARYFPGSR